MVRTGVLPDPGRRQHPFLRAHGEPVERKSQPGALRLVDRNSERTHLPMRRQFFKTGRISTSNSRSRGGSSSISLKSSLSTARSMSLRCAAMIARRGQTRRAIARASRQPRSQCSIQADPLNRCFGQERQKRRNDLFLAFCGRRITFPWCCRLGGRTNAWGWTAGFAGHDRTPTARIDAATAA